MKTSEFFKFLENKIKENEAWPEIIDYSLAERNPVEIEREGFDIKFDVHFGSNEGIYLSIFLEGIISDAHPGKFYMGTIKTLVESKQALQTMSLLGAEFVWEGRYYVNSHIDEFIRYGYKIIPEQKNYSIYVANQERALVKVKYFLEEASEVDSSVLVVNLKTRKEKKFKEVPEKITV